MTNYITLEDKPSIVWGSVTLHYTTEGLSIKYDCKQLLTLDLLPYIWYYNLSANAFPPIVLRSGTGCPVDLTGVTSLQLRGTLTYCYLRLSLYSNK